MEVQFYALIPLLWAVVHYFFASSSLWNRAVWAAIALVSFGFQCWNNSTDRHMRLEARVWQFMAGFFAFFAHQAAVEKKEWNGRETSVLRPLVSFLLVVLLLVPLTSSQQVQRWLVVLATSFLLAAHPYSSTFRGAECIVRLGDCSYGVYLVHWPLITFWRMVPGGESGEQVGPFGEQKTDHQSSSLVFVAVGVGLLVLSIADGWLVEECCNWIVRRVDSWFRLLLLLGILYLTAFSALFFLHRNEQELREVRRLICFLLTFFS